MAEDSLLLQGMINKDEYLGNQPVGVNLAKPNKLAKLGSLVKTSLFMEALRNLNWSRDYLWYVELDGVPTPFHRGGVLGLPCTNIQYTLSTGSTYKIPSFMQDLVVPY